MLLHARVVDVEQRTPAWVAARVGRLGGSQAADMLAVVKGGEAAGRRNLRTQLALEQITGYPQGSTYISAAMAQGVAREAAALDQYELAAGHLVRRVGYLAHRELAAGGSPDGVIGDWAGLVEVKCPLAATHFEYLRTGTVPDGYKKQVQHLLWLSGARWCDWVSYCPEFPPELALRIVRIDRDDREMASYALAVALFLREVEATVAVVRGLQAGAQAGTAA